MVLQFHISNPHAPVTATYAIGTYIEVMGQYDQWVTSSFTTTTVTILFTILSSVHDTQL